MMSRKRISQAALALMALLLITSQYFFFHDIYTVALHEVGHALGLDHLEITVPNAVMNPTYGGARRLLSQDDINGIQSLYGIPEPSTLLLSLLGLTAGVISYRRNSKA